jgi:hypothetical protein
MSPLAGRIGHLRMTGCIGTSSGIFGTNAYYSVSDTSLHFLIHSIAEPTARKHLRFVELCSVVQVTEVEAPFSRCSFGPH